MAIWPFVDACTRVLRIFYQRKNIEYIILYMGNGWAAHDELLAGRNKLTCFWCVLGYFTAACLHPTVIKMPMRYEKDILRRLLLLIYQKILILILCYCKYFSVRWFLYLVIIYFINPIYLRLKADLLKRVWRFSCSNYGCVYINN